MVYQSELMHESFFSRELADTNFYFSSKEIRIISSCGGNELIAKATYDQRSHGIVHVRHLYESHLPVLREELEGFHGEAVLGKSFLDLFFSYRSSEKVN